MKLFDVTLAFVMAAAWIGVFEGLIKPLLAYQTQRLAREYLPKMFDLLDPVMPESIALLGRGDLEQLIFEEAMGLGANQAEAKRLVDLFDQQYSPLKNAELELGG